MNTADEKILSIWMALALAAVPVAADAQDRLHTHPCAAVAGDSARLACYDAEFGKPGAAVAATAAPVAATAVPAVKERKEFGLSEEKKRALDPEKAAVPQTTSITGKVAGLGRRPTGELIVTLDHGQVWVQAESDTLAVLKVGDAVTIRKGALGSYLLVTPGRVAMRVRRAE